MWQHWYEQHGPVDFIAVAADAQGPKAAQPWVERAGATFAVAVDSENKLGALLGYTVVPTGVFVDEKGAVRHLQAGDFSVRNEQTVARVERFLTGDVDVLAELNVESSSRLEPLEQELVDAKVRLASELLARGGRDEALEALGREHLDKAELVKLRFYVGLSIEETAQALGLSEKTIQRNWIHARAWLFREINRLLAP